MTLRVADRILETSTTTGTGAFTLDAAVTGFRRFSAIPSIATNDTLYYCIVAVDTNGNPSGDWEAGLGTYSAANTLTRTTPQASTNGGAAVNFAAGTKYVMLDATAGFIALLLKTTDAATAAQIMAGTADKVVMADKLHDAHAPQTLTDGATISWDMAAGFNAKVTLGGNRTLGTPTNPKVGLTYVLEVIQDGTGSRTMTWPASFNWGSAGTPTLSTTAAKVDLVTLYCRDAATPKFRAVFNKDS